MNSSISIIISAFLLALVILFLLNLNQNKLKIDKIFYRDALSSISANLIKGQYQIVVIDCDKLTDRALKDLRLRGNTMADRLKNAKALNIDLNQVWQVHKLRNKVAHEVNFEVSKQDAKKALNLTEQNLKKLKIL